MGRHEFFKCIWYIRHFDRDGNLLWEDKIQNMLVDQGEKAIVDTFYRNQEDTYFGSGTHLFYVGMYRGAVSESTILATVPGEPAGDGYARQSIERSTVGWPEISQDENKDWQVLSTEIYFEADGGDIGPVDGYFIGTSDDNSGALIGIVAFKIERTIRDGERTTIQVQAKMV